MADACSYRTYDFRRGHAQDLLEKGLITREASIRMTFAMMSMPRPMGFGGMGMMA